MSKLLPDLYVNTIFDIDLKTLKAKGIDSIIVDIDNTLVSWETEYASEEVVDWFKRIKELGFKCCIISNNTKDRVVKFNRNLEVYAIHRAVKPRKKPFLKAIKLMNTKPSKTVVIGDQIFTDILGGNRLGAYTILVVPISKKEFFWTRIIRKLERRILRKIEKVS
ncbi:YqeG family HAD IIIA-type phosphatase [Caloranaerobacter ferrireducens]|uniref:YqeG family HAD IIIA-type phosphatase n=1 Tax=Caloranaerobacter ferrireducens TaxID=1323370 RepID=UPI00084DBE79|nr:YqeG family HAD IIIA-type phosphatase [Caloranaerobacter ferrireducens]